MNINEQISRIREMMGLDEAIGLNLSKQTRKYQKRFDAGMDDLFGKNVYRLYYDLDTGKMITPTRRVPSLDLDVNVSDSLRRDIDRVVAENGFVLVDFDGNRIKNAKTGQELKLTKLLQRYDVGLLNKYTGYLDSMTRAGGEGKLYAVISRHSHDILNMGDSGDNDQFSTCENLSDIKDIKQTMIRSDDDDDSYYDGNGIRAGQMIRGKHLVFYMIKEGDWNIKDPLGRFASGVYCHYEGPYYGVYNSKFTNFVINWVNKYELKYQNERGVLKDMETYWSQPINVLVEAAFDVLYHGGKMNNMDRDRFVRELINHERYDVLLSVINRYKGYDGIISQIIFNLTNVLVKTISPLVVNKFPAELRDVYFDSVYNELHPLFEKLNVKKETDEEIIQRIVKLRDRLGTDSLLSLINAHTFQYLIGMSEDDEGLLEKYDNLIKVYRLRDPKMADKLRALIVDKMARSDNKRYQILKQKVLTALENG